MKNKLLIFLLLISSSVFAQNRMYNLTTQFDSVKVRKLLMTSILEGGVGDSVVVKKANGGLFKVARSSFGGNYTASQGVGVSGNNITLGGTASPITGSSIIAIDPAGIFNVTATTNTNQYYTGTISARAGTSTTAGELSFGLKQNSSLLTSIVFTPTKTTFNDNINARGLEYPADYSANYNARTLVDKAYVDSKLSTVVEVTANSQTATSGRVYILHNAGLTTVTLPTTAAIGDLIQIIGEGGSFRIAQNANQYIAFGNAQTTTGTTGYIQTNSNNTFISLRYVNTNKWLISSSNSTPTVF